MVTSFVNKSPQQYGITPPISTNESSEASIELTNQLVFFLQNEGLIEDENDVKKRHMVLSKLNEIIVNWIQKCAACRINEDEVPNVGGFIYTFGSYRLGVNGKGADIDTLCIAPSHIDRQRDFFGTLYDYLKSCPNVSELSAVPDAYVPVIKMVFDGVEIDLLLTILAISSVSPTIDVTLNQIMMNLDKQSILSLNGCRVTDQILKLVPSIPVFRTALRCIKYWAKQRCIYNNSMGYLGGVAWAMLVVRICQLFPNFTPFDIVARFFQVYYKWRWPTPVIIRKIEYLSMGHEVWNPAINERDKYHLMPVITPAYPAINSTHNVIHSTLKIMTAEFRRGVEITTFIETGKNTISSLFSSRIPEFFSSFRHFIKVYAVALTPEAQTIWAPYVEARLRFLVGSLEKNVFISTISPLPIPFEHEPIIPVSISENSLEDKDGSNTHLIKNEEKIVSCAQSKSESPDDLILGEMTQIRESCLEKLARAEKEEPVKYITSYFMGLEFASQNPLNGTGGGKGTCSINLSDPAKLFNEKLKIWPRYDAETMSLEISYCRKKDLPLFIKEKYLTTRIVSSTSKIVSPSPPKFDDGVVKKTDSCLNVKRTLESVENSNAKHLKTVGTPH